MNHRLLLSAALCCAGIVCAAGSFPYPEKKDRFGVPDRKTVACVPAGYITLTGGPLVPEAEIAGMPTTLLQDTPLIDLIGKIIMRFLKLLNGDCEIFNKIHQRFDYFCFFFCYALNSQQTEYKHFNEKLIGYIKQYNTKQI